MSICYLCEDCRDIVAGGGCFPVDNLAGRKECYICGDSQCDLYCYTLTDEIEEIHNIVENYFRGEEING